MKKAFRIGSFITIIFLSTLVLYHCATNPVTGKKELMLFSEAQEINMGKEVDRGVKEEYGIYYDPALNDYIARLGQKLAPLTHRPHLKYQFAVLDTPVVNAFAAPGGYIYVTRGLLAMMNSEAELAAVLGHELGHVAARHSMRSMSRNILFSLGLVVASELSEDIKDYAPLAYLATQLLFLKYSRSDEYQADSLGLEYAGKCGFQAGEMVNFFNSLQRMTAESGGHPLPNFLSTHPLTPKRIARVQEIIKTPEYLALLPQGTRPLVNRNPYLRKIDSLVYGMNPRQGYVQGNAFYHPGMRFLFQVPSGWQVQNTPKKVTLAPKNGKAVIIFTAGAGGKNLDEYVNKQLSSMSGAKTISEGYANVNGLRAFHKLVQSARATDQGAQQNLQVRVTGISKGNQVFSFFAAAESANYGNYRQTIDRTIGSFKNLGNSRHLAVKPKRVRVRAVARKVSLKKYLSSLGIPQSDWGRIAMINSLQLDGTLTPKQLIKIIQ